MKQSGVINSNEGEVLATATIIAKAIDAKDFKFTSADLDGKYQLQLITSMDYEVTIRSLGYVTLSDTVNFSKDSIKNYILEKSKESLDSILVKARAPVLQKGDTTAYRVEYFLTGNERKARDILEKIPGIEVDGRGNVQVNGKDVTTLMVDGKIFFSGDEKLGVNNIPSDVIDEIEIIQNYDPIPFMKNLRDSEQIALNIKLKEDKQNFFFGEIGAGGGYENIYTAHANLFYYSKKLGVNFISGASNDGQRIFTLQDYIDFEGGSSLLLTDAKAYFALQNSSFGNYLNRDDFIENRNIVGAFNAVSEITPRSTLSAYSVWLDDRSRFNSTSNRFYPQQELEENLETNSGVDALLGLTKLKWQYRKTLKNYWDFTGLLRTAFSDSNDELSSVTTNRDNRFTNRTSDLVDYSLEFNAIHNAQWSEKSYITWETKLKTSNNDDSSIYNFNQPVFSEILNFTGDPNDLLVDQNRDSENVTIASTLDYFWNYGRRSQLNPRINIEHNSDNYQTLDQELLRSGRGISFKDDGFNNDLKYRLTTYGAGLDHTFKNEVHNLTFGFMVNQYDYTSRNFENPTISTKTLKFLPAIDYSLSLLGTQKISLDYNTSVSLPNSVALANRFRLTGYNSIFRGNPNLDEKYIHNARLYYSTGARSLGYLFNGSISLNSSNGAIRASREFEDIDQITTYIFLREPNSNLGFNASYLHLERNWRFGLNPNYRISSSSDVINNEIVDLKVVGYGYRISAISSYKNLLNVNASFRQQFNNYDGFNNNRFTNTSLAINLSHDISDNWILSSDFSQTYFKNNTTGDSRQFGLLDISGEYKPSGSSWIFNMNLRNIFDVDSRSDSSVSDFIISQKNTFILPFRASLGISYTL
ncbi:carboxypeptidase-like regulatory domain-containing protein [Nonlabens antarcticus]|uniref:carboxypeptidase-like regulatory domain-containing protein n=1 Tax=Nonlabens antarcticus TaxID=392714 RepID=UPI001891BFE7|nr:carboxypeptidase-like regulatory domain-containing protein [Nonlabens antarcticus]